MPRSNLQLSTLLTQLRCEDVQLLESNSECWGKIAGLITELRREDVQFYSSTPNAGAKL
jgi:hypothetical protein